MKIRSSVKKICSGCKIIKRGKRVMVICKRKARHKQKQG